MKIQYLSDLHLEFKDNSEFLHSRRLKVTGDVLVVAGDTYYLDDGHIGDSFFLKWAADNFGQVLLIPGNHEFYGGYDVADGGSSWECRLGPNVGYYQNKVVTIGDTDFILSTMWSYISPENQQSIGYFLNDFHRLRYRGRKFTPDDFNTEHAKSLAFIKLAVAESKSRHRIVVTHHVPSRLCTPKKLAVIRNGTLEQAFTADLTDYIEQAPIDYWIYGHSHVNADVNIGGTTLTSNQLGYVFRGENQWNGFSFGKHITV